MTICDRRIAVKVFGIRQIVEVRQCQNYTAKVLVQYTASFPKSQTQNSTSFSAQKSQSLIKNLKTIVSTIVRVTHAEAPPTIVHEHDRG